MSWNFEAFMPSIQASIQLLIPESFSDDKSAGCCALLWVLNRVFVELAGSAQSDNRVAVFKVIVIS